jgi:hypothetical protein
VAAPSLRPIRSVEISVGRSPSQGSGDTSGLCASAPALGHLNSRAELRRGVYPPVLGPGAVDELSNDRLRQPSRRCNVLHRVKRRRFDRLALFERIRRSLGRSACSLGVRLWKCNSLIDAMTRVPILKPLAPQPLSADNRYNVSYALDKLWLNTFRRLVMPLAVLGQSFCGIAILVAAFDPDASVTLAEPPLLLAVPRRQRPSEVCICQGDGL